MKLISFIFIFFSKKEISEIFVYLTSKTSNFSNLDIDVKSLMILHSLKSKLLMKLYLSINTLRLDISTLLYISNFLT